MQKMIRLNKRGKDRAIKRVLVSTLLTLVLTFVVIRIANNRSLVRNGVVSNAYVYLINEAGSKGANTVIKYYFDFKGKRFYGGADSWVSYKVKPRLLNQYFPVLIDSTKAERSILLTSPKWWGRMNIEMPDSVKWILEY